MRIGVPVPGRFLLICLGAVLFPGLMAAQTTFTGGAINPVSTVAHTSVSSTAAVLGITGTVSDIKITLNLNLDALNSYGIALTSPNGTSLDIVNAMP